MQAVAADSEEPTKYPSLRILPQKMTYQPFQATEIDATLPNSVLLDVGCFEGMYELRVSARTKAERETIEDLVTNVLLSSPLAPGVIAAQTRPVTVGGWITTHQALVSFTAEDLDWREELVFSKRRYSFIDLNAWYPALVMRSGVFNIEQLILAFSADLTSNNPAIDEAISVNQDGSFTKTSVHS